MRLCSTLDRVPTDCFPLTGRKGNRMDGEEFWDKSPKSSYL